jgi:flagellar biosynthesis protein FlhG
MTETTSGSKVIDIRSKLGLPAESGAQEKAGQSAHPLVIAITSGKGGVGKTNIVANLGYSLSRTGRKVLILDADFGLGNLDVLLGLAPKYNLSHVIAGQKKVPEIIMEGPGGMTILPASSGIEEMTKLTAAQKKQILDELDRLLLEKDVLLIDTAAGISTNVMYFNSAAQEVIVVVSPEPTSLTDAYALMKIMSLRYGKKRFNLLVNMAVDEQEGMEIYRQLRVVSDKFLDIDMIYLGHILRDDNVTKCVRKQKVISQHFPTSLASQCFAAVSRRVCDFPRQVPPAEGTHFFLAGIGSEGPGDEK